MKKKCGFVNLKMWWIDRVGYLETAQIQKDLLNIDRDISFKIKTYNLWEFMYPTKTLEFLHSPRYINFSFWIKNIKYPHTQY